jgi:hypothetical protein
MAFKKIDALNGQVIFLLAATLCASLMFVQMNIESIVRTIFLFLAVGVLGVILISNLSRQLDDQKLNKLTFLYILKLAILPFLLYLSWLPSLDINSTFFGYDPQRFYFHSRTLLEENFDFSSVSLAEPLNYVGIIYYFSSIFLVFGKNPVVPALVNSFVTLIATLLLVKVLYTLNNKRGSKDWMYGLAMIMPEVLWFDMITSRETIVMSLLTISNLLVLNYIFDKNKKKNFLGLTLCLVPCLILISLIRSTAIFAPILSISILAIFFHEGKKSNLFRVAIILLLILIMVAYPIISLTLGSSGVGVDGYWGLLTAQDKGAVEDWRNTEGLGSFAGMLIPDNFIEAILFTPLRLLLNLLAPIGVGAVSFDEFFDGNWPAWQFLMMSASALINLILFPFALVALWSSIENNNKQLIAFNIPVWITLFMIAGGNFIIHERYRVMSSLLLWGLYCLGFSCSKSLISKMYKFWFVITSALVIFYCLIKIMKLI